MSFRRAFGFAVLLWQGLLVSAPAQVVINELCADNTSLVSAAGTLPDYVELYNKGTSSVSLAGWTLTDDVTKPAKWAFPGGTTIGGKSHLVVWLDSAALYPGLIVTSFSLRASGEEVALFQATNQIDYIRFGPQIKNRTICRYPSGGTNWTLGLQTPGATNISVA
ncbi:MAG TPA: lamin tail domain-containing protein, partial [Candidatus Dormibacteraeota bacterium]|nr:lamin tail domain-containing protein [Candidatus Dormibacteraeota bacterium]